MDKEQSISTSSTLKKQESLIFNTPKVDYDPIKIYCPFHRDQLITLVCIENECNEKLMCSKCQLYNNTNKHEMISIEKFAQVIRNHENINIFDAEQQMIFEGKSLKTKLSLFMKAADELRDQLIEQDLKAIENIMNDCLQQTIAKFSLLKEKVKNSYYKKIEEVISQDALHNYEFKLKALEKVYKFMRSNDYSETNASIIHLHQGGYELEFSLQKNNQIFGDFRNKVEIFSIETVRSFKIQIDEFSKVFSDFEKRQQSKMSSVARKVLNQQKFIQEAKINTTRLPNLITPKSDKSERSLTQSNTHSAEKIIMKQLTQNQKEMNLMINEPQIEKQDEALIVQSPSQQQIAMRKSSQFYVQQMKRSSGLIPSKGPTSFSEINLHSNAKEQDLKLDLSKQIESPRNQIELLNKKQAKQLAQNFISPLKMITPNRFTSTYSQKMDQSLTEFLDFNNASMQHQNIKKQRAISKTGQESSHHQTDLKSLDTSKIVIHDFINIGKDLFAAGTNNGFIQIWKYIDFKFTCIFQTLAHYSPISLSTTNVSGILFSHGINQKGQNSIKIWNNDTESSLTEIIEILELHPIKSTITHLISLAEIFKGSSNSIIFATYGTDDLKSMKVWDFSFDNKNFHSSSTNQIRLKQSISTDNNQLQIIKQDFDKNIFIGCSQNSVIFWKYFYNKDSQRLDVQKLHSYTFKINLDENRIVDLEMGESNVYVATKNGEIALLELNGVFIKSIQFFTKYLKQTQKEDVSDMSLKKVLYSTTPEKIIILCQKGDHTQNIIPYLFDKTEAQHEIMTTLKIQLPLKLVIPINDTQFITLEKNNILKYNYL